MINRWTSLAAKCLMVGLFLSMSHATYAAIAGPLNSTVKRIPEDNGSNMTANKGVWKGVLWYKEYYIHKAGSGVLYTFAAGKERSSVYVQILAGVRDQESPSVIKMYVTYTDGTTSAVIDGTRGSRFTGLILLNGYFTKSSKGKLIKSVTCISGTSEVSAVINSRIGSSKLVGP